MAAVHQRANRDGDPLALGNVPLVKTLGRGTKPVDVFGQELVELAFRSHECNVVRLRGTAVPLEGLEPP